MKHVWGNKYSDRFTKVQTQAMRFYLWVGKMCPNAALYGEMRWKPVNRTIEVVLKYWFRLCNLQVDRVTRSVFSWSSYLAEEGYCNWAKRTQGLLGLVTERLDGPLPGNLTEFGSVCWRRSLENG